MNKTKRPFWQRWKRIIRRWLHPHNDALQKMFQKGRQAGLKEQVDLAHIDVLQAFQQKYQAGFEAGRRQTDPYICTVCRSTEPLPVVTKPGDLARMYHRLLQERGRPPSQETLKYRTIKLTQEQYDEKVG